jgi:hypothetical protein
MLVPAGIIWPFPRSISFSASRGCTGTGGNSRIASLRTWNTIQLTLILYSWWDRNSRKMCLGYSDKESESLIVVDILRNEISVSGRLSDWENVLHSWPLYAKDLNLLPCVKRSKALLTNNIGNADWEGVSKHPFTYYFENGRVNQSMSLGYKSLSGVVFWDLFKGGFKHHFISTIVYFKKSCYVIWEIYTNSVNN